MIDYREYRVRVNRDLDEHREPLEDPQVVAFLDAHPEHLQAFAEERADLEQVAELPPTAATDASPRRPWLVAAAAVVLFGLAWFAWSDSDQGVGSNHSRGDSAQVKIAQADAARANTARVNTTRANTSGNSTERRSRILFATLHEVEPTVRPAAFYTVRDPLVHTANMTLEAYEQRSELR